MQRISVEFLSAFCGKDTPSDSIKQTDSVVLFQLFDGKADRGLGQMQFLGCLGNIILLKIFVSTLYLSAFTFGGGYVIVTLMKKTFVDEYHWIEEDEMLDLIAIAQSAPGAIAVNGAIVVGYKLAGMIGALTAIIATIIPPFVVISLISVCYNAFRSNYLAGKMLEGMQAGVGAVIASVVFEMAGGILHGRSILSISIMAAAFIAACFFQVNVIYIILLCGLIGVIRTLAGKRSVKS